MKNNLEIINRENIIKSNSNTTKKTNHLKSKDNIK